MVVSTMESLTLKNMAGQLPPEEVLFGTCRAMKVVAEKAREFAKTARPILIEGASGTGKDTLARWIHEKSSRSDSPFIKVHCPAIDPMLLDGELFGHAPGAMAHALKLRQGRIESAQGGTLFIDGVSDMDPSVQERLRGLVKDGHYRRVGDAKTLRADVRLIFSCRLFSSDQKDLFSGINAGHLRMPLLRERLADVPALAAYMVEAWGMNYSVPVKALSREIVNLMQVSSWPGNLRQLENVVKRYVVLGCEEETISAELLGRGKSNSFRGVKAEAITNLKDAVRKRVKEEERKIILRALHDHRWKRKDTARALGITYQSLLHKMRQLLPSTEVVELGSKSSHFIN
ncbi:MAG: sigma-54-dependent Fis family transcriptional regulator [Acidobacteriota bacterium]|nr:sigma-54-dependent Fis family transcriptional regulator [Acidobacteriota bacterium]